MGQIRLALDPIVITNERVKVAIAGVEDVGDGEVVLLADVEALLVFEELVVYWDWLPSLLMEN